MEKKKKHSLLFICLGNICRSPAAEDRDNYRVVTSKAPNDEARKKVCMLTDYLSIHKGTDVVPDPYYGDLSDFDYALDLIEDACDGLLERY